MRPLSIPFFAKKRKELRDELKKEMGKARVWFE